MDNDNYKIYTKDVIEYNRITKCWTKEYVYGIFQRFLYIKL